MKEEFCPACAAIPLALAGAGSVAVDKENFDTQDEQKDKKKSKPVLFWVGISLLVLALGFIIYWVAFRKSCKSCP